MKFSHLLTREEPIAGLEIDERYVRLALFEPNKRDKNKSKIKILVEQPLVNGVVVNGNIEKPNELVKSLQILLKNTKATVRYCIVSIPTNNVYSRIFSFPQSVGQDKLEETMDLAIGFQLPFAPDKLYIDWEKTNEAGQNNVFLATIQKKNIDPYLEVLGKAKINPVAIEFRPLSISRVVQFGKKEEPLLLYNQNSYSTEIFILQDGNVKFIRVVPSAYVAAGGLNEEIRKIADYYEAKTGLKVKISRLDLVSINDNWKKLIKDNDSKWLVSIGAAWRGVLSRSQDTLISLMPIGTEEAYEYQKAIAFTRFVSGLAIILSLFFVAIFGGVWVWMVSLQRTSIVTVNNSNTLSLVQDPAALEEKARQLNNLTLVVANALKTSPQWYSVLSEIKSKVTPDIVVNNLAMPAPDGTISIKGVAKNRSYLNLFKTSLEESSYFMEVKLPLTNLEQKENIPFTLSFRLKDQSILYPTL